MNNLIKKILLFLAIYISIAITTTFLLIENNKQKINNSANNDYIKQNTEKGIDLYGMYNENDLLINEMTEIYNNRQIKIPQIEGLKNLEVQNKINKDIYNRIYKLLNVAQSVEHTYFDVASNFSNIVSIEYRIRENGGYQNIIYLNYNLLDGEKLKIEDIFIKDADITGIIRKAFYMMLSKLGNVEELDNGSYITSPDENELYKVVKNYIDNGEKQFLISPSKITFLYHDLSEQRFNYDKHFATIDMADISDSVSIYNKYLTDESIYQRNDIGRKNIFTLVNTHYDIFDIIDYGYLEENFWYDITISKLYFPDGNVEAGKMEKFNKYVQNLKNEAYGMLNEYREKAKKNPDKFYIFLCTPNISMYNDAKYENGEWIYNYSNMAISNLNIKVYEMPIELYDKEYKDKIINGYRYDYFVMAGGAYYTIDEPKSGDGVIYTKDEIQRKYNYMINKEIVDLSDIFYEDVNYIEILEETVKRQLKDFYHFSESEAEEVLKSVKYDFEGWQIRVEIPQKDDFWLSIGLETFDKSMLNIFDKED